MKASFDPRRLLLHTTLPFKLDATHTRQHTFRAVNRARPVLNNPQGLKTSPRIYNISAKPLFNMSITILSDSMPRLSSMQLPSSPSPHLPKYRTQH